MSQPWRFRRSAVTGFILALTSCVSPSDHGTDGKDASVRLTPEPPGARCPQGGTAIQTGLDDNGDGVLNDSEVQQTSFVCSGGSNPSGQMSLVKLLPEESSTRCASGGIAVLSGLDSNADGLQNDSEVTSTQYLCNSSDGLNGSAYVVKMLPESAGSNCPAGGTSILGGIDVNTDGQLSSPEVTTKQYVCQSVTSLTGAQALIRLDVEPSGANCSQGGTAVKSGLDLNANGKLDVDEVSNTTFVCNGLPGRNGKNALVRLDSEPAGSTCAYGGTSVKSGLDSNGDGTLSNQEVQTTQFICSSANLFRTKWASNPAGTYASGEISNVWVPAGRRISLYKTSDTSRIKITVSDGFRVGANYAAAGAGTYSVRMNGSGMGCDAQQYNWNASSWLQDYHMPFANVCLTEQLPKGLYEFEVWAIASGGTSYVGAGTDRALLLAEELDAPHPYAFSKAGGDTSATGTAYVKATGREVTFVKQTASTLLKVTLADTLRVGYNQNGGWGTVMLWLDGSATNCYTGKYGTQGTGSDFHNPFVLTCILPNVSAAQHTLQVALAGNSGGLAYLGWGRSNPLLLVEEIPNTGVTYSNTGFASGELSGNWSGVGVRQILHTVSAHGKTVKVTYSDTFRATYNCNGRWGAFQLYVDNQPSGCVVGQYSWNGGAAQDQHRPVNLTCIIPNLAAGIHTFAIWSSTLHGDGSSCGSNYFGWNRGQNLLLVEEMP
ncbi:DUF7151 family protein [Stigmatella aurantiaca]|uniref:Conserved uncharacterized protein n=1 Tax=Stigmatella aurantiaca (strain DW4/3-1) TaxID=378806 RepID=Q08R46_STIAD|nr:hypothetical protein [Stigmatella aurantiaca]ADO70947.1 conserved uncharacterized protein [Stigmatella aurantiaca DW4/3-1]EAU62954.1 hypothetical protein STIAU_4485 [Stigmatella aurantiaca DW4/3-1]